MNKTASIIFVSILACVFQLSACSNNNSNGSIVCTDHIDIDSDGFCDNCGTSIPPSLKEFENITFSDATFDYDGKEHSIYVTNLPSFANANYEGNGKSEPGNYVVTACVTAEGYKVLNLTATMTILEGNKEFEGLIFNDLTVEYDGNTHTILVENLPSFAKATYKNNSKTGVGTYQATATVTASGYNDKTLTATLTIKAKEFQGITFEDECIEYDGYNHSIYVKGAPDFASISYSGNGKSAVGTYTVTATIKATGYKTLTLTATMKIGKFFKPLNLPDRTLIYDGSEQNIIVDLSGCPSYTTAEYKVDGKSVDKMTVKTIGTHTVSVTLTNEKYGYETQTFSAKIRVIEQTIGTIDASKEPFAIKSDIKFQELRKKILERNFTTKVETADDYFYPDGTSNSTLSSTTYHYVDGDEAFSFYSLEDKESNSAGSYRLADTSVTHDKIVGNEVLSITYEEGLLSSCYKYSSVYYDENVTSVYGLSVLTSLAEKEDGGIESSKQGGYTTTYGEFEIDEENNTFVIEKRAHYYHTEWNHDEVTRITIYNIGNTMINMIPEFDVTSVPNDQYEVYSFVANGMQYYRFNDSASVNITFDSLDCVFLERKPFILLPEVDGIAVKTINYEYYDKYYGLDLSGYVMNVYFDSTGKYQGDYQDFGYISGYKNIISHFESYGGKVNYYGQW